MDNRPTAQRFPTASSNLQLRQTRPSAVRENHQSAADFFFKHAFSFFIWLARKLPIIPTPMRASRTPLRKSLCSRSKGFTLIELMVVISLISFIAGVFMVAVGEAKTSARDARRKTEISQMLNIFISNCYMPIGGPGEYDLAEVIDELKERYPQAVEQLGTTPLDPKTGTSEESRYMYMISGDGRNCIIYANLEREGEAVTLEGITAPEPGRGTGVFQAPAEGWNGSTKYYQAEI